MFIAVFSAASDGAFWSFSTSLMKDSVANYGSILTLFLPSVSGLDVGHFTMH